MVSRNAVSTESSFGMHTPQTYLPKKFKTILRESTVYQYIAELKENTITEQGLLDIVKVPRLRVEGAGQFVRTLRRKADIRQKDLAKIFTVTSSQMQHWEHHNSTMPLHILVEIAEYFAVSKDKIYTMIEQGEFALKTAMPIRFEEISPIVQNFYPQATNSDSVTVYKYSKEIRSKIKELFNLQPIYYPKQSYCVINSRDLHRYFKTFFRYTKVPKINPPLTNEVKRWYNEGVDLKRAIIIPCLQSDGTSCQFRDRTRLIFSGFSKRLHNCFVDAMYYKYKILPTTYFYSYDDKHVPITEYQQLTTEDVKNEIMNLAGNTKTKPAGGQTVAEYLKEPQPHLNYLIHAPETEQKIALRIWASTEGSIGIEKRQKWIYPDLKIGCAHPILVKQLQYIAQQYGIHFTINKSKRTWSGIGRLNNKTLIGCRNFLKLGNFIKGVKIRSSPYHRGIEKDVLILGILEYIRRTHVNGLPKKLSTAFHHHKINHIVENKGYHSSNFYISYFSQNDTML